MLDDLNLLLKTDSRQFFYSIGNNKQEKLNFILSFYEEILISQSFIFVNNEENEKWIFNQLKNKYFNVIRFPFLENNSRSNLITIVNTKKYPFLFSIYHFNKKSLVVHFDIPENENNFYEEMGFLKRIFIQII